MMDRRAFLSSLVAALAGSEIVRAVEVASVPALEFKTLTKGQFPPQDLAAWRMPWFYHLKPGKLHIEHDFQLETLGCEMPDMPVDQIVDMLSNPARKGCVNGPAIELLVNGKSCFNVPVVMIGMHGFTTAFDSAMRMPIWPAIPIPAGTEIEFRCPGGEGISLFLSGSVAASADLMSGIGMDAEFDDDEDEPYNGPLDEWGG